MIPSLVVLAAASIAAAPAPPTSVVTVRSKDGTAISAECAGSGPSLVIVHGGTGDHTRWTPLFPYFATRFNVCAMDRRGFGRSGDAAQHSLLREAEDVRAVVSSRPGGAFVLGHSYGGVAALEAAFLTEEIHKLVLYEPPLHEHVEPAVIARMERSLATGDRAAALGIFLREVVKVDAAGIEAMKARPVWARLLATIHQSPRQMRALNAYRFDAGRVRSLRAPVLLVTGSETVNPSIKRSMASLRDALANGEMIELEGEDHFAMDTNPERFARTVGDFLLGPEVRKR